MRFVWFAFVVFVVVTGLSSGVQGMDSALSLIGSIDVGGTPDTIVIDHSPFHNDVVFYDRSTQRIHFIDAETLTLSSDFIGIPTTQWEGWLVSNRVHHLVYFIGSRWRVTDGGESWEEVLVHVIDHRAEISSFSINEPWNPVSGSPQDSNYEIDGVVLKQPYTEDPNGRIIVDNTYGGNIDVVDFTANGIDYFQRQRGSYRDPVTTTYFTVRGNSIALETNHETAGSDDLLGQDLVYIADANGPPGQVTVIGVQQSPSPLAAALETPIDLTSHYLFANTLQGLAVSGPSDRLWVAPGSQGSVNGALGEVNTVTAGFVGTATLNLGDQYHILVDWNDPSRLFVCTFDGWYNDPDQALYLNLVVDGSVVETLQLVTDYDEYNGLKGMAFDPYTGRLYVIVDSSILVVDVAYGTVAEPPWLFADGFENGDTDSWSGVAPG